MKLPVYIHSTGEGVGGPQSFLKNLASYLSSKNLSVTTNLNEARVLFISVSCPLGLLLRAKFRNLQIVQRLDGLHYKARNGKWWWWKNKKAWLIYKCFADHIVFQTDYARRQVTHLIGAPRTMSFSVIMNGTNSGVFHPVSEIKSESGKRNWHLVTSGNFRHQDMIRPLVKALDELTADMSFTLFVVGPVSQELQAEHRRSYIQFVGQQGPQKLAKTLQGADLYLYSALNSVCPNALIEALACGVPAVAFDSGGVAEILGTNKELLVDTPQAVLHQERDFDVKAFALRVRSALYNLEKHQKTTRLNAASFDFAKMGGFYLELFRQVTQ